MDVTRSRAVMVVTVLLYAAVTAFSCAFSRADGGSAMLWVASAILAAGLAVLPVRYWLALIAACAAANVVLSGFWSHAWLATPGFALINIGESVLVSLFLRWLARFGARQGTHAAMAAFVAVIVLGLSLFSGLAAACVAVLLEGRPFFSSFVNWSLAHGVGFITVLPVTTMLSLRLRRGHSTLGAGQKPGGILIALANPVIVVAVFTQHGRGWLLAPLLAATFAAVWSSAIVALALPVLTALVLVPLTLSGMGPLAGMTSAPGGASQIALLYQGLVALCALPIVVEQERRRRELGHVASSEARYRAQARQAQHLVDELRHTATTDPLTGLANRRAFFERAGEVVTGGRQGCIAIVDVDYFKLINDRFGHAGGDAVLRAFSDFALSTVRSSDLVARVGGEEFAILFPDTAVEKARHGCQRLVDRLGEAPIGTEFGPISMTVSGGIAGLAPQLGEPPEATISAAMAAADRAMYRAKREGRGRLNVAESSVDPVPV